MKEKDKSSILVKTTIGVDIGGTKIESVLVRSDGSVATSIKINTPSNTNPDYIVQTIYASIDGIMLERKEFIKGIGIGAPGQVDLRSGKIIYAPNLNWHNVPLRELLQKKYALPVFVDNDVRCAMLAEYKFGSAKNVSNFFCVFVGTGIGGGIMVNGKVLRGTTNSAAEIGHITIEKEGPRCNCGNLGCLESLASGPKIIAYVIKKLKEKKSIIKDIVDNDLEKINIDVIQKAFELRDKVAIDALERAAEYIGAGVASLINVLNPEMVILGGGVINASSALFAMIKDIALKRVLNVSRSNLEIVTPSLKKHVGAIGASLLIES